jgi:hypothetical protein
MNISIFPEHEKIFRILSIFCFNRCHSGVWTRDNRFVWKKQFFKVLLFEAWEWNNVARRKSINQWKYSFVSIFIDHIPTFSDSYIILQDVDFLYPWPEASGIIVFNGLASGYSWSSVNSWENPSILFRAFGLSPENQTSWNAFWYRK